MKILYDYQIFLLQKYGGISRYFYELIKEILDLNNEETKLFLFQGLNKSRYDINRLRDSLASYWGCKCPDIKKTDRIFNIFNHFFFNLYKSKNTFKNSDVIYHPTYYSNNLTKPYPKNKIVVTVFDMIHENLPEYFLNISHDLAIKRKTIEMADEIICISNNTKKDLLKYYNLDEKKVHVVFLGTNLKADYNINNSKDIYKSERPFILFVGKRGGYKNFTLLLKSYYYGKFYEEFDLICFGGNFFTKKELKSISKYNLKRNVKFLERGDELLAFLYNNAVCLIYPSKYEGFGLPLIEAMGLGCPVIASKAGSIPEIVGDSALLFNPEDEDELISKLNEILSDSKKRRLLIEKGFRQSKKYSWKNTANKTLSIYRNLINKI